MLPSSAPPGGFFHFYYMAMLAPPSSALAGIGAVRLWRLSVAGGWRDILVAVALLLTAAWQLYIEASALKGYEDGLQSRLHGALLGGALLAAGGLVIFALTRTRSRRTHQLRACAFGTGLAVLLLIPVAWALSSVLLAGPGVLPSADLARLLADDGKIDAQSVRRTEVAATISRLIAFLTANRQGERYLLATSSTGLAAPIIIRTGEPVMALGGFQGLDRIVTPEQFADTVGARQVRFVMMGDLSPASRRLGAEVAQRPIAEWVRTHGKLVEPRLWRMRGVFGRTMQLYDLRPDTVLIPALSDGH